MNILPPGITGFYHLHSNPPPAVDEQVWKRACYHVARQTGGTVIHLEANTDVGVCNYYATIIRYSAQTIAVLCNAHYPLVAFTDQLEGRFGQIQFIAVPHLTHIFTTETTFTPLEVDYLSAYPDLELLAELQAVEREQIQYWKPQQIGDIIFNHWD